MNARFRLPYITAKTVPEQITQIISYLRQLALQLQQLPETAENAGSGTDEQPRGIQYQELCVRKDLTVRGDINGVYIRGASLNATDKLRLQSRFSGWDSNGYERQSFLLSGNLGRVPVLGLITLDSAGNCGWTGTEGVSVTAEAGGIVQVRFSAAAYDRCLVLSPEHFSIL